jgi:hypothetical protein
MEVVKQTIVVSDSNKGDKFITLFFRQTKKLLKSKYQTKKE